MCPHLAREACLLETFSEVGLPVSFDWRDFLERRGIEYVTSSPNIGRGELGIKCPFCGSADPSQHMSINLEGRGWMCRRARDNPEHRGKSDARLVRALIGCSAEEAARIVGSPLLLGTQSVLDQVEGLVGVAASEPVPRLVELAEPREFRKFAGKVSQRPYLKYMERRGFTREFVYRASAEMGLRYCVSGPFSWRVIFLVHHEGRLVNWTGRAIAASARRRYQAHTPDPEMAASWGYAPAATSIEGCLLWYDDLLEGGELLEVVEGPMDALKLRMLGRQATCLFTNQPSRGQIDLLRELAPRFARRVVLLDRGAEAQTIAATSRLASLGFRAAWLPAGADDPGELTARTLDQIRY